jgi:hypothetical protein
MMAGCYVPKSGGRGGTISVLVSEHATLDNVKAAVEKIVLRYGTIECGIGGFDLSIRTDREAGYPRQTEEIAPGVGAVLLRE